MNEDGTSVEEMVNRISDMDAEWWPFLFLRPEIDQRLTDRRVAGIAVLYGVFVGMLANAGLAITHHSHAVHVAVFPLAATAAFFVAFRTVVAHFWNRRAERLAVPARRLTRDT